MSEYMLTEIKPGDTVRHLKGNQEMKIVWVADYFGKLSANCEWPVEYESHFGKENMIYRVTEIIKLSEGQ